MSKKKIYSSFRKENQKNDSWKNISTLNFQNFTIAIIINNFGINIFDISHTNIEKNFTNFIFIFFWK